MKRILNKVQAKIQSGSRVWKVGLYQVFLVVAAVTGFASLRSPSTMSFFAFEIGIALAGGFFLSLRGELQKSRPIREERRASDSPVEGGLYSSTDDPLLRIAAVREEWATSDGDLLKSGRNRRVFYASTSLFVVFLSLAFLDLARSMYTASLNFYALVGLAAGVLALNIQANGEKRTGSLLIQLMILAALVKFHFLFLNPYVYTSDNYLFYLGLVDLSAAGSIPQSLGHYFFFPGFAAYAYSSLSLLGVPLELFNALGFVAQIAMLPIVYLIGRHIANRSVGLFASLFVLFSIYAFLYTHASPTHYGLAFVILAVYGAIRIGSSGGRVWFAVFWLGAIAAMLSHPVNALVLGLVLTVRVIGIRLVAGSTSTGRPVFTPVLSYAIIYGSYLAFIAYTAFDLFVLSILVVDYSPPLASPPSPALERTASFIIQSALAPLGIVLSIFFAGYAVLGRRGISGSEHGFLVALGASFLVIPGLEFLGENFRLQSSRMLIYFVIPFAFLGAYGLWRLARGIAVPRRAFVVVLCVFMASGFLAASSYLTQNDLNALYTDVPFSTSRITASALGGRQFLELTPTDSTTYMDSGSFRYFSNQSRARDSSEPRHTYDLVFFQEDGGTGYVFVNQDLLPYGVPRAGAFYDLERIEARLRDQDAPRLYDSGGVQIYYAP